MKKFIVIALLVMPFVLIYFISFSGRILSKYTHINIENIYVSDTNGNIYNNDSIIQINKGDVKSLQISILPTLASNKSIVYSNSDKSVCKIDEKIKIVIDYRLKYPELSLSELSEVMNADGVKISKSGLNHRFRKIKEILANLEKKS